MRGRFLALVSRAGAICSTLRAIIRHALGRIGSPVSPCAMRLTGGAGEGLVAQPVGDLEALSRHTRSPSPNHRAHTGAVPASRAPRASRRSSCSCFGESPSLLDVPLITLDVLAGHSDRRELERGVDLAAAAPPGMLEALAPWRALARSTSWPRRSRRAGRPGPRRRSAYSIGLVLVLAPSVVVREDRRMLLQAVGVEVLDGPADRPVQVFPALRQQALVGHVLGDGVLEDVFELGEEACFVDHARACVSVSRWCWTSARRLGDPREQAKAELASDDGRGLDRPLDRLLQAIDPRANDVLDGGRELRLSATPVQRISPFRRTSSPRSRSEAVISSTNSGLPLGLLAGRTVADRTGGGDSPSRAATSASISCSLETGRGRSACSRSCPPSARCSRGAGW